jgi:hypothetical protein
MVLIYRLEEINKHYHNSIISAAKEDYKAFDTPEKLAKDHSESILALTSHNYASDVLKFLCTENDECRTPTEDEITLANKFVTFEQFYALLRLGKKHAETALKITSSYAPNALKILCTENEIFRTPTEDEITLANKFVTFEQFYALTKLSKEYNESALKITSYPAADVLKFICTENGVFRTPTQEDIELAHKFHDYNHVSALEELGIEHAETALKITAIFAPEALKTLCTQNNFFFCS